MGLKNCEELGRNLQNVTKRLLANDELVKLLYYPDEDPLAHESLNQDQKKKEIFNKLIKIVPRIGPKEDERSYLSVAIFEGNIINQNTDYRRIGIAVEIFVPLTAWIIKDVNLRPFAIMGQVQNSLQDKKIDGIGKLRGGDFRLNFLTEEIGSYKMTFWVEE